MDEIKQAAAVALSESDFWLEMSPRDIAEFQLNQRRLCMPFDVFHGAVEAALERPVWTHEFADRDSLLKEFNGESPMRTMDDILNLIPEGKRLLISV